MVQGQNRADTDSVKSSALLHSPTQAQLYRYCSQQMFCCCKELQRSTPGQCSPALKVKYWFCFCCLTCMFLLCLKSMGFLHLWPQRTGYFVLWFYKSVTEVHWALKDELWDLQWAEGVWGSTSPPPVTVKRSLGDNTGLWLVLLQEQNLPVDLAGSWSFSLRRLHACPTKAVSIASTIFQNPLWL